jgi:hypothetical protein
MAYGCQFPLLGREREHHILVGPPASSLGVGRHRHVQLVVDCTGLVVPCVVRLLLEDGSERQPQRLRVHVTGLYVRAFPVARPFRHDPQVFTYLLIFIMYTLC